MEEKIVISPTGEVRALHASGNASKVVAVGGDKLERLGRTLAAEAQVEVPVNLQNAVSDFYKGPSDGTPVPAPTQENVFEQPVKDPTISQFVPVAEGAPAPVQEPVPAPVAEPVKDPTTPQFVAATEGMGAPAPGPVEEPVKDPTVPTFMGALDQTAPVAEPTVESTAEPFGRVVAGTNVFGPLPTEEFDDVVPTEKVEKEEVSAEEPDNKVVPVEGLDNKALQTEEQDNALNALMGTDSASVPAVEPTVAPAPAPQVVPVDEATEQLLMYFDRLKRNQEESSILLDMIEGKIAEIVHSKTL